MQKSLFFFLFVLLLSTNALLTKNQLKIRKTSQNSLKAATLSVGAVSSGSFTLTALVPASDTAISYQFLEGTTVVLTGTLTAGNSNPVPLTYAVSGKAAGTYSYSVLLWDAICISATSNVVSVVVPTATVAITNTLQPATLSVGTVSSGAYTLTASIPSNNAAVSYKILEGTTSISAGTLTAGNLNKVSVVNAVSGKAAGSYSYTVVLLDAKSVSVSSNAVVVVVPTATVAITNTLQAATLSVGTVSSGAYTLTASIPCGNAAVSYKFFEGTTVIAAGTLTLGNVNQISLANAISGKAAGTYSYTVVLLDANSVSVSSNAVVVTVPAATTVTVNSLQAATLSVGTITSGAFTLSANIPCYNTAVSYKVLEGTTVIAAGTLTVGNVNQISLVNAISGKAAGTYSYTLVLLDASSVSVSSNVLSVVVPATTTSSTTTTSTVKAWAAGTAYKAGDIVSYSGKNYKCLTAHTSIVSWEPTNAFTLWSPQ